MSSQEDLWVSSASEPTTHAPSAELCIPMHGETVAICTATVIPPRYEVAGIFCYSYCSEYGNLFTVKKHQRKGLESALIVKISDYSEY